MILNDLDKVILLKDKSKEVKFIFAGDHHDDWLPFLVVCTDTNKNEIYRQYHEFYQNELCEILTHIQNNTEIIPQKGIANFETVEQEFSLIYKDNFLKFYKHTTLTGNEYKNLLFEVKIDKIQLSEAIKKAQYIHANF